MIHLNTSICTMATIVWRFEVAFRAKRHEVARRTSLSLGGGDRGRRESATQVVERIPRPLICLLKDDWRMELPKRCEYVIIDGQQGC